MFKLIVLFENDVEKIFHVSVVWQDYHYGFDCLYYETLFDERGKGHFLKLDDVKTWKVETY